MRISVLITMLLLGTYTQIVSSMSVVANNGANLAYTTSSKLLLHDAINAASCKSLNCITSFTMNHYFFRTEEHITDSVQNYIFEKSNLIDKNTEFVSFSIYSNGKSTILFGSTDSVMVLHLVKQLPHFDFKRIEADHIAADSDFYSSPKYEGILIIKKNDTAVITDAGVKSSFFISHTP